MIQGLVSLWQGLVYLWQADRRSRSHSRPRRVQGSVCLRQADIHAPWGGVVPTLAMEAHAAAIDSTVAAALESAGITAADLDAVAVTVGPGLSLCLRVSLRRRKP